MNGRILVIAAMYVMYLAIGGLSTTNILRLTKGSNVNILVPKCFCDACGTEIKVTSQIPIFSYLFYGGKCSVCGAAIPIWSFLLECVIAVGMSTVTTLFRFSYVGVLFSFLFYEIVRIVCIAILKKRERDFARQYVIAVLSMVKYAVIVEFAALLYRLA